MISTNLRTTLHHVSQPFGVGTLYVTPHDIHELKRNWLKELRQGGTVGRSWSDPLFPSIVDQPESIVIH